MTYKIEYYHTTCSGLVDTKKKRCTKCGKKWGFFGFLVTPGEIRPRKVKVPYEVSKKPVTYAKWADKLPFVPEFASRLPNWPKWLRYLVTAGLFSIAGSLIWWILR